MPVRAQTKQHDLSHVPSLSEEEKILSEKLAELENSVEEFQETVHELRDDHSVSQKIYKQMALNSEEMLEDAKKHTEKARQTKHDADYRFAMGWIEGCIEMLNKPLRPQES